MCIHYVIHRSGTITGIIVYPSQMFAQFILCGTYPLNGLLPLLMQFYSGGVLDIPHCSRTRLSHAMLIIGYGTYKGKDYWLLKNRYIYIILYYCVYLMLFIQFFFFFFSFFFFFDRKFLKILFKTLSGNYFCPFPCCTLHYWICNFICILQLGTKLG